MTKIKIKRLFKLPRVLAGFGLAFLVFASLQHPLSAQTVTQGYSSDQPLQRGLIVQIKKSDATKVEPVSQDTIDQMHGVIVDANDAPVTLSTDSQKVFVATVGHFAVLVSNQNGPIASGDYITVSAIDGIGMKAGTTEPVVVGRALDGFDGKTGAISSTQVKDSSGNTRNVNIGRIQVDIGVARNPLLKAKAPDLPEFLQRASEAIAGKPVNAVRVYVGLIIFIISTVIAGSLLYGGVRSAIISIGRNPLSRKSIIRGMLQVILTGIIIFISGILAVYLLLRI
ncbi:MAG TPA: hypothetical protein VFH39_01960 [Candidatus Saccharimonadales bacterium]|nr:hypothetical protein [Candidatus Saccharimonadales bacterium]